MRCVCNEGGKRGDAHCEDRGAELFCVPLDPEVKVPFVFLIVDLQTVAFLKLSTNVSQAHLRVVLPQFQQNVT